MSDFYPLKVEKVVKETPNATTLFFELSEDQKKRFQYKAGQYLTLNFDYGGETLRRAYSISTSPFEIELSITCKRIGGGKISVHINENIAAGDIVEVMLPEGKFTVDIHEDNQKDYYFFAAGSGITPIFSIIKTILEEEPKSRCFLLFGNKDENNIIYQEQIKSLEQKYKGQFVVRNILSQATKEKQGGVGGFFKKAKTSWLGWQGRIDERKVDDFFKENPIQNKEAIYLVCGPEAMINNLHKILKLRDIPEKNIIIEHFGSTGGDKSIASEGAKMTLILNGESHQIEIPVGKTILDAAVDAGHDVPFSCSSGACSTCVAKVNKGEATMEVCYGLDDNEIAEGYILTCQAHSSSKELEVEFES